MSNMPLSLEKKLLFGRLLTRSGDQAWDFTVPLALLQIFPNQLRWAALYYFLVRLSQVIFLPRLARFIDRESRLNSIRVGIGLQTLGVLLGTVSLLSFWTWPQASETNWFLMFGLLVVGGLIGGLGSSFTEIAIANDLVPASIPPKRLAGFNSRLRRVDLFTEVTSPIAAGFLLMISVPGLVHAGFLWVVLWNLFSFVPEYLLLASVLRERPDLNIKKIEISNAVTQTFAEKLFRGWRVFFANPIWPAIACYAILWLSVLSPHGVLLTAFLKDGWTVPEWMIGAFRGSGAAFGLAATFLFPVSVKKFGLVSASRAFVLMQALCLIGALFFFYQSGEVSRISFLILVLLSRVGLYGFSLGEMQIRQVAISAGLRGEMNGFANALTSIATLGLYGSATLLPSTEDFNWLVLGSTIFVSIAAVWFSIWANSRTARKIESR